METLFEDEPEVMAPKRGALCLSIHVPAIPVAQPRPRAVMGHGGHARMHEVTSIKKADGSRKAHPIAAFKATVRLAVERAYHGAPIESPVSCSIVFVFPRPKGMMWTRKAMPRVRHTKTPDRDNCDKAVLDAIKGLIWKDDCQVCAGSIEKWIAAGDEQPHVTIVIEELA